MDNVSSRQGPCCTLNGQNGSHHLKKHVTTACQACRRKRCKCDGLVPCSTCLGDGTLCVFDHNDGRRQSHNKVLHKTPSQRCVTKIRAQDADHNHAAVRTNNNKSVDASNISQRRPPVTLAMKSDDRSRNQSTVELDVVQNMLGQFETRPGEISHVSNAELRVPVHRKLLPKDSSAPPMSYVDRTLRENQANNQQASYHSTWRLERRGYAVPGYTRTFGNLPFSSSISANGYPSNVQMHQSRNFSIPDHLIFPLIDFDESPLGRAYTDFQQLGRRLIAEGVSPSQVADQGRVDVTLFFRDRLPEDPINASSWTSEMLRAFRGTFSDELLLACAVCVQSLMRWLLLPTNESYADLPPTMRPTMLQRVKPHPSWVDLMIFPSFRNALIDRLRDWVEPCVTARWEILWPHPLETALQHNPAQRIFLTKEFAAFAKKPQNWRMQQSILNEFSEIRGTEIIISQT